jgi:tRNA-dihydrouridine synthase B
VLEMRRHYSNYFKGISHFKETRMQMVTEMDPKALMQILAAVTTNYEEVTL